MIISLSSISKMFYPFHINTINGWKRKLTSSLLYRLMTRMQGYLEDMLGRTTGNRDFYIWLRNVDHNNENVYRHFKQALMLPHDRQK